MKLKEILGLTSYLVYGGGNAHYKTDAVEKFKFQRFFVSNNATTQSDMLLRVEPTEQNFKYDTYLQQLKDLGITRVFSPQGKFDFQDTIGKAGKVCPINEADDPLKQESWKVFGEYSRQIAIRYADDTAQYLSEAKVFTGTPAYLSNTPKAGLGLIDYYTGINEINFKHGWSGATRTMTREMAAVCFKVQYDAVRSVSKTLKIVIPSSIEPTESWLRGFLVHLKSLYEAEGKPMPSDFYLDFHWYMRNSSQDQSGGTAGETPETVNAYAHGQMMDALCEEYGLLGWMCTETGWATDNSKQSAPILEGFTREQSQGILMIRLALIWGASKYCKGISFWHCRDDYDLPPYAKGGINKKDWSAKPARTICEEFLAKYGEMEVEEFRDLSPNTGYAIKWKSKDEGLVWTDKKNFQSFTPSPTHIDLLVIQPTPMLTIQDNKLYKDGQPFFIRELNSPETILRVSLNDFKAIVDYAVSVGLNAIYCSLYAGDKYKTTLHPYNGAATFGNPTSGFAEARLLDWKEKLEYAASKGFVLHLLLSEKENHFVHTDAQQHTFIDKMVATFGHLPVIWDREEFPTGNDGFIVNHFGYLRIKDPNNIIAIHNNTGQKPWAGHSDIIDLISIQADISSFDSIIKAETANGFAAYASEMTGGFQANDTAKAERIRTAGGNLTSGAGIYIASLDQDATLTQLKAYEPVHKTLSGTTPNPIPMRKAFWTNLSTPTGAVELEGGENLMVAKYAIYVDGAPGVDLELFKDGVSFIAKRREGAPPLAVGGDDNGALRLKDFPVGIYRLTISGQPDINFTVGTVTPPTEVKGTTFVKKNGKIEFAFEDGTKLTVTAD